MKVIGLTGPIAAGKSTVAKFLAAKGAVVIDADKISRDIVKPGSRTWAALARHFGESIIKKDRSIDREKLGRIAFGNRRQLDALNKITHPAIERAIKESLETVKSTVGPEGIVVIDNPLLVEMGLADLADVLVVVTASPDIRLSRLLAKGLTEDQALERMKSQADKDRLLPLADYVIKNDGSIDELKEQVAKLFHEVVEARDDDDE